MDEQPSTVNNEYDNTSTSNTTDLSNYFDETAWKTWSLIPACAILILFCFLEKRVNLWPTCCHGRPGVAFPVNLVDSYNNRWAFAFAFGSMSTMLIQADGIFPFTANDIDHTNIMLRGTVTFFAILINALVISLVFYPILLCLQTQWKLLGNIFGLLYSIIWFVFYIGSIIVKSLDVGQDDNRCPKEKFLTVLAKLALFGGGATFFLALMICFLVGLTKEFRKGIKLIVLMWLDLFGRQLKFCDKVAVLPEIRKAWPGFNEVVDKREITVWITSVVAVIFTVIHTIDMQLRYRKHTVMLWKGDRSFVPEGKLPFSTTLVASLRYSGYNVAFTMWGFVVMQLLLWVVLSIIILFKDFALILLKQYWLTLVVTFAFYYAQVYISQIVFLQRAPDQQEQSIFSCRRQTSFGLDNRHVFHVTVYILMFVNFILGMLSCFVRISKALLFGTLYIGRLDRLLLMRDWETWDKGYTAYVGFLQLEVAHTHPVLATFCHFLQETVKTDQASSQKYTTNELVSIVNAQIENGYDVPETTNGRCYSPGEPSSGQ
ncbi:stimulated by retinoic acid gene 6 protein-like, partial [Patiria miniata]|uniref:Uncharacterized protein n=1 Tax=Patiria miniata TaxID=46514 RepID=A0A914B1T6_PATMI